MYDDITAPLPEIYDWRYDAVCKDSGFYPFFEEESDLRTRMYYNTIAEAKRICRTCPVKQECLDEGLSINFGVWGGKSPEERREMRINMGLEPQPIWRKARARS